MEASEAIKVCQGINARYERSILLAESVGLAEALRILREEGLDARGVPQPDRLLQTATKDGDKK